MTPGPKTVEAAMALPELSGKEYFSLFLGAAPVDGDTIVAFVDADGIAKEVRCVRRERDGSDEWVKVSLSI